VSAETFYVMQYIDGDECLLFHRPTLSAAREAACESGEQSLSIWSSTGGMLEEIHYCACCGDACESGADCCTDEFPEPGELREWA